MPPGPAVPASAGRVRIGGNLRAQLGDDLRRRRAAFPMPLSSGTAAGSSVPAQFRQVAGDAVSIHIARPPRPAGRSPAARSRPVQCAASRSGAPSVLAGRPARPARSLSRLYQLFRTDCSTRQSPPAARAAVAEVAASSPAEACMASAMPARRARVCFRPGGGSSVEGGQHGAVACRGLR